VNGVDYRELDGMETCLKPSDIIAIFPPVAGG
jgi:molybdopterin converting factor small subunit